MQPFRAASTLGTAARRSQLAVHALVQQPQQDFTALNAGIAKFYDESSGLWEDM